MNIQTELAKLLDKNEYRVIITKTDGGCIASFPRRVELPTFMFARLYQEFVSSGVDCTTYSEDGAQLVTQRIKIPSYACKMWTIYNIVNQCALIGYSGVAIKFVIGEEEVNEEVFLREHLDPFVDEDDKVKEEELQKIISTCFQQGFQPQMEQRAISSNVLEGYLAVKQLLTEEKS